MQAGVLPVALVIVSLGSALAGLRGLLEGRRIAQADGPNTLMHYPAPLPWLRQRVTAARWVIWIGHLYLSAGLAGLLGAWIVWTAPMQSSHSHMCEQIGQRISGAFATELQGGRSHTTATPKGCTTLMHDHAQVRWFSIQSSDPEHRTGSHFNEEKMQLERSAYKVRAIEDLGTRAGLAESRRGKGMNPVLFFTDSQGHHRVEINGLQVKEKQLNTLIAALRSLQTSQAE